MHPLRLSVLTRHIEKEKKLRRISLPLDAIFLIEKKLPSLTLKNKITMSHGNQSTPLPSPVPPPLQVVYSGAVQIPICYGSISFPLPHVPGKKETHRRWCYIRDGADIQVDAFYRFWLDSHADSEEKKEIHVTSKKRLRAESEAASEVSLSTSNPSCFYDIIDHVDFVLPRGFPHSRRTVSKPPFVVEDESYAEHLVEIHLYFKAELCILPMALLHHCRLYRWVAPPPSIEFTELSVGASIKKENSDRGVKKLLAKEEPNRPDDNVSPNTPILTERSDLLRIFHPSLQLVRHVQALRTRACNALLIEEQKKFLLRYQSSSIQAPECTKPLHGWELGFEKEIELLGKQNQRRPTLVLEKVLDNLHGENELLKKHVALSLGRIKDESSRLHAALVQLREACSGSF